MTTTWRVYEFLERGGQSQMLKDEATKEAAKLSKRYKVGEISREELIKYLLELWEKLEAEE